MPLQERKLTDRIPPLFLDPAFQPVLEDVTHHAYAMSGKNLRKRMTIPLSKLAGF
jgi:geranylgeranyl pyrophosphate synthase